MVFPHNPIPDDAPPRISKTRKKQAMHELQELGDALVELSADTFKKMMPSLGLPENLEIAIREAQRMTKQNEAKRRQLQYIGKLLREVDPEPIRAALEVVAGASAVENARLHRLEKLREKLLEDETTLTAIGNDYPGADLGQLRQLRRNALKEKEQSKPPKSFRQIFQVLRELETAANGHGEALTDDLPEEDQA